MTKARLLAMAKHFIRSRDEEYIYREREDDISLKPLEVRATKQMTDQEIELFEKLTEVQNAQTT